MVRGLMTDREWKFFAPFVIATGGKSGRPPADHRLVLDGVFWIARTGAQWRDLHEHFGNWSSVYRQFRRWTLAGVFELMLAALNDGGGNRRYLNSAAGGVRRFYYDGDQEIAEYDSAAGALLHRDDASAAETTDYVSAGPEAVARVVKKAGAFTPSFIHADHLGSPIAATGPGGAIQWRERHAPFGKATQTFGATGANDNQPGFTGHLADAFSDLVYMQARLYDPAIGRFYAIDPVGWTGDPASFNRYAYVYNDPVVAVMKHPQLPVVLADPQAGFVRFDRRAGGNSGADQIRLSRERLLRRAEHVDQRAFGARRSLRSLASRAKACFA